MKRYIPVVYGGIAALAVIRAMARGGLGTFGQQQFVAIFVPASGNAEE